MKCYRNHPSDSGAGGGGEQAGQEAFLLFPAVVPPFHPGIHSQVMLPPVFVLTGCCWFETQSKVAFSSPVSNREECRPFPQLGTGVPQNDIWKPPYWGTNERGNPSQSAYHISRTGHVVCDPGGPLGGPISHGGRSCWVSPSAPLPRGDMLQSGGSGKFLGGPVQSSSLFGTGMIKPTSQTTGQATATTPPSSIGHTWVTASLPGREGVLDLT